VPTRESLRPLRPRRELCDEAFAIREQMARARDERCARRARPARRLCAERHIPRTFVTTRNSVAALALHDRRMDACAPAFGLVAGAPHRERRRMKRLALKAGSRTVLLDLSAIDWVEAAGNYLVFHVGRERYTVRNTMRDMEPRLAEVNIVRIHRSTFVNIERVKSIEPIHAGDQAITLDDGVELVLSRTYRDRVYALLFTD
jgi:DNA-binding LytR/AlgR family response regulator